MPARTLSRSRHVVWMQTGLLALSAALALAGFVARAKVEHETRLLPQSWRTDMGEGYAFAMIGDFARTVKRQALDPLGLPRRMALPPLPASAPQFPAKLPSRAVALVKHLEAEKLTAYRDLAGVLTIGYGHTGDVTEGSTITARQADVLLTRDLHAAEDAVRRHVQVRLNVNEFSALVSLVFNVGEDAFARSSGLDLLNAGARRQAAAAFLSFNKARVRGQIAMLSGLVRRRRIEEALFLLAPDESPPRRLVLAGEVIPIPASAPPQTKPTSQALRVADAQPPADSSDAGDGRAPHSPLAPRRNADDVVPNRIWPVG